MQRLLYDKALTNFSSNSCWKLLRVDTYMYPIGKLFGACGNECGQCCEMRC